MSHWPRGVARDTRAAPTCAQQAGPLKPRVAGTRRDLRRDGRGWEAYGLEEGKRYVCEFQEKPSKKDRLSKIQF